MPSNSHIRWLDITDFAPGVFASDVDADVLLMPENAAQLMEDCFPQPGGGLRAFWKATAVSTSGLNNSDRICTGLGMHSGLSANGLGGDGIDRYVAMMGSTDAKPRLFRRDGTDGETVFTQSKVLVEADNGDAVCAHSTLLPFIGSAGVRYMLWVCRYTADPAEVTSASGNGEGLYRARYDTSDVEQINGDIGPMTVNQARVIQTKGIASEIPSRVFYGEPGTSGTLLADNTPDKTDLTPSGSFHTQYVDIAPSQDGAAILMLAGTEPSDILVGRANAPWASIQGNIEDTGTPIRELAAGITPGAFVQDPCRTPYGLAFVVPGRGIHITNGRDFTDISAGQTPGIFKPDVGGAVDFSSWGQMAFNHQWLFTRGGYVYDFETKSWFRLSAAIDAVHWVTSQNDYRVWGVDEGAGFGMYEYRPYDDLGSATSQRCDSYTWRSAAWHQPDGRETRIREVEVFYRAPAAGSFTLTRRNAFDTGAIVRASDVTAGRGKVRFLLPNNGSEYQDITIEAAAETSTDEAPIIERIRVGFAPGHATY